LRDDRALRVGLLASASHDLEQTMSTTHSTSQLSHHIALLQTALTLNQQKANSRPSSTLDAGLLGALAESKQAHQREISNLKRPSRWIQIWPRFLLIPPAAYIFVKYAYGSRASIMQHAKDAWETTRVFWGSWVVEPINGILATVRTRGDAGVRVISKDALRADMEVGQLASMQD
jgi:nuclear-control-of-ATPase protein 2